MTTLTIAEYSPADHDFFARTLEADACSGEMVFLGKATDDEIREYANNNLCAPDCGSFDTAEVLWEESDHDDD